MAFPRSHDWQNGKSKIKPDIPTPKIFLLGTKNSPQGSYGQHFRSEIKIYHLFDHIIIVIISRYF